ncbi:MAG: hypothetical protein MI725_11170, partial [Pirellulales bacterium]|nr:hypothetical protein [Pirellulales bacterium]
MRTLIRFFLLFVLIAQLSSAQAAYTLVEDYEGAGMTVGSTFDGVNGWVSDDLNATQVAVDPTGGVNQVGHFLGNGGREDVYKALPSTIADGTTGTLFFQVYLDGDIDAGIGLSDQAAPNGFGAFESYAIPDDAGPNN